MIKFPKIYHLSQTSLTKKDIFYTAKEFSEKVDGIQFHIGKIDDKLFIKTKNSAPLIYEIVKLEIEFLETLNLHIFLDYWPQLDQIIPENSHFIFEYVNERTPPSVIKYDLMPFLVYLFPPESSSIIDELNKILPFRTYHKNIYDRQRCLELLSQCESESGIELENEFGMLAREYLPSDFGAEYIEGLVIELTTGEFIKVVPLAFSESRKEIWGETEAIKLKRRKIASEYFKTDLFNPRTSPKIFTYIQELQIKSFDELLNFFVKDVIDENKQNFPPNLLDLINKELNSNYNSIEEVIIDLYKPKLMKIWSEYLLKYAKYI